DYWVLKVDGSGNIIWQKKYGGNELDNLYTAIEAPDGGYLLLGQSDSSPSGNKTAPNYGNYDIWAVKTDSEGNIEWNQTYGGDSTEFINTGLATSYGYMLASRRNSGVSGNKTTENTGAANLWLVGIDFLGNILWQNSYGGPHGDGPIDIISTSDNNILISGQSNSSNFPDSNYGATDFWLLKLDIYGNLLWQNNYGGSGIDEAYKAVETPNGNFIVVGHSNSPVSGIKNAANYGGIDFWILKIDSSGTLLWENSYGGDLDDSAYNVIATNTGYFVVGTSLSGISSNKTTPAYGNTEVWEYNYHFWGFKIDIDGTILWQKSIGGDGSDGSGSIVQNSDGTYLLAGSSDSPVSGTKTIASYGNFDYWLIKLEEDNLNIPDFENNSFTIYPNPVKDYLTISLENNYSEISIELYNLLGQRIFKNNYANQNRITIDCTSFSEGLF